MRNPLPGLLVPFQRVYYYGLRYQCPFCHSRLRKFLPYGVDHPVLKKLGVLSAGRRANARCPCCGSLDRERLLYLYLLYKTSTFLEPLKLLHLAPEKPLQRILCKQHHIDYVTADLYRVDVMVKADINSLPFPVNSFDGVICNHVLEYIEDDRKALAEIRRVLRSGGWAILMEQIVPSLETTYEDSRHVTPAERNAAYGDPGHRRLYGRDYQERIAEMGFGVEVFQRPTDDTFFGGPTNTFGLLEGESVYIAFKGS